VAPGPASAASLRIPVKICGLTRPDDARLAVSLGASYLGVIFADGPRRLTPSAARAVVAAAESVPVYGVFGQQQIDEIFRVVDEAGLRGVQLHREATAREVTALRARELEVLAVVRLADAADLDRLDSCRQLGVPLLVEPRVAGRLGGTGTGLPLDLALEARSRLEGHCMFLAGGLTPDNVAAMVRAVRPDAVDVSSGIEQIPGIKDPERMARFLEVLGWA
jgi:phosphoribosylanthranilate isomerase